MTKEYSSRFVPDHKIDLANFLTEILVLNYLKQFKKNIPTVPFWRKEYSESFADLSKRYYIELIGVKDLLKVFYPETIAEVFTQKKCFAFSYLKMENRYPILYELYKCQVKNIKNQTPTDTVDSNENNTESPSPTSVDEHVPFTPTKNNRNVSKITL
jgi:hypothetical protein